MFLDDNVFELGPDASAADRQAVIDRVNAVVQDDMTTFESVNIPADSSLGAIAATDTPIFVGVRPNSMLDFFVNIQGKHYAIQMSPENARQVANVLIETSIKAELLPVQMATADASRTHVALFMKCREYADNAPDALLMHRLALQEAARFQEIADPETQKVLLVELFGSRDDACPRQS
jgi:hypothetical protein